MKHVRTLIREEVANILSGRAPLAAVYTSRTANVARDVLPCATVFFGEESSAVFTQGANPTHERTATLNVQIRASAVDESEPDQQFDAIADTCAIVIEQAIAESDLVGTLVKFMTYAGMDTEYTDGQPEGLVTLTWVVRYMVRAQSPDQPV